MSNHDVYHLWLGIAPQHQPPNHYQLLGISTFESNLEVIRNAADRQLGHVRKLAVNEYADCGQELLNEIAAAKICLLNPDKKLPYDEWLRSTSVGCLSDESVGRRGNSPWDPQQSGDAIPLDPRDSLVVGADLSCDLRIDSCEISGVHCKIFRRENRMYLKDLHSRNGTYVNFQRIQETIEVSPLDLITLGPARARVRIPASFWPRGLRNRHALYVGRHPANDLELADVSVSAFHARILSESGYVSIEDLNSTNGTTLWTEQGEAVRVGGRPQPLDRYQSIRFGTCLVRIADILRSSG